MNSHTNHHVIFQTNTFYLNSEVFRLKFFHTIFSKLFYKCRIPIISILFLPFSLFAQTDTVAIRNGIHPKTSSPLTLYKVFDRTRGKGEIVVKSNDTTLKSISQLDSIIEYKRKEEARRYGKISHNLRGYFTQSGKRSVLNVEKAAKTDTGIVVDIYLRRPLYSPLDKTKHSHDEMKRHTEYVLSLKPVVSEQTIVDRYNLQRELGETEALRVRLTPAQIEELRFDKDLEFIEVPPKFELHSNSAEWGVLDYRTIAWSSANSAPLPSYAHGAGVNVGTVESGIWSKTLHLLRIDTANIFVKNCFIDHAHNGSNVHSNATFSTLVYNAPEANFFSANQNLYHIGMPAILDYLYKNKMHVMSISYWIPVDSTNVSPMMRGNVIADMTAYYEPYTLFCISSGNSGPQSSQPYLCYNHLIVGASRHVNLSYYDTAYFNSSKNPPPIYGTGLICNDPMYCGGDRELPNLLAPGTYPTQSGWYDYGVQAYSILEPHHLEGTSFSSPSTAGQIANMMSAATGYNPVSLNGYPELRRAVMMLTSQDVDGFPYYTVGRDGRDGAGTISGAAAAEFARTASPWYVDRSPVVTGYTIGGWYDTTSSLKIAIRKPDTNPGSNKKLRVVLTWSSIAGYYFADSTTHYVNELSDLDLRCQNCAGSFRSSSFDNNYEIIEITWEDVPSPICTVTVDKYRARFPDSLKQDFFYCTVAWDWVKTAADTIQPPASPPSFPAYQPLPAPNTAGIISPKHNSNVYMNCDFDGIIVDIPFKFTTSPMARKHRLQIGYESGEIFYDTTYLYFGKSSSVKTYNYTTIEITLGLFRLDQFYKWRIGAINETGTVWNVPQKFRVQKIPQPVLIGPCDGAMFVPCAPRFEFSTVQDTTFAFGYIFLLEHGVSLDPTFTRLSSVELKNGYFTIPSMQLKAFTRYDWWIKTWDPNSISDTLSFTTGSAIQVPASFQYTLVILFMTLLMPGFILFFIKHRNITITSHKEGR